jgi:hypothetical protein
VAAWLIPYIYPSPGDIATPFCENKSPFCESEFPSSNLHRRLATGGWPGGQMEGIHVWLMVAAAK